MNRILSVIVTLSWGLWIGGIVGVTLSVITLAKTFPPKSDPNFGIAAPNIFTTFERYQLVLAGIALVATFLWRPGKGASLLKTILFALFALGATGAVVETLYVAPKIKALRSQAALSQSNDFDRAHQLSERIYGGVGLLLIGAGVVLVMTIRKDATTTKAG